MTKKTDIPNTCSNQLLIVNLVIIDCLLLMLLLILFIVNIFSVDKILMYVYVLYLNLRLKNYMLFDDTLGLV